MSSNKKRVYVVFARTKYKKGLNDAVQNCKTNITIVSRKSSNIMKRDDNALFGKESVELIHTCNRRKPKYTNKKILVQSMKECRELNSFFDDHRINGNNTVKPTIEIPIDTPITRIESIDSESDTISRAKTSINGNKRKRRLFTDPSQGDLNLALIK